jgi:hypothetical protein
MAKAKLKLLIDMNIELPEGDTEITEKEKCAIIDRIHEFLANGTTSEDYEGHLCFNSIDRVCDPELLITEVPQSTISTIEDGWSITDPSCNQMMKKLSDNRFIFKEDRVIDPITKKTETYESEIDLAGYTQDEMFESVQSFGYSFNEMCSWIDDGKDLSIIAECIFELEN